MDTKSIRAYARAERLLTDALERAGANVPEDMFDRCCEHPAEALAELHRLARANGVLAPRVQSALAEALSEVDPDAVCELNIEEQGTYILAWYAAEGWEPDTLTVPEAAREAGVTTQAIRDAIVTDPAELGPRRILGAKPRGRWIVDRESFERWMESRG